jgi:hypothetical protein
MRLMNRCALILSIPVFAFPEVGGVYRGKDYDVENEEKVLDKKNLMVLDLILWDSTLQDAQKKIANFPIQERHYTSGEYDSQLCYKGADTTLLLNTGREREDPQLIQTVIVSSQKLGNEIFGSCRSTEQVNKDLTFIGGLRLGMSRVEVEKIWGKPGKSTSKVVIYEIRRIQKEWFTDDVSIYLEFKNNKLTYISASRTGIP